MTSRDPGALRRRLRIQLKALRLDAGRTQREVAEALEWSPSKVIRIESGAVAVSSTDLRAMLGYYGLKEASQVEEMLDMARQSKRQRWTQYKDILSPEAITYMQYISAASSIRLFAGGSVPGVLQTEDYTRSLMLDAFGKTEDDVERFVEFRGEYRDLLRGDPQPRVFAVLDEAVIRRAVGGRAVMEEQLDHLSAMGKWPNVTLQIIPFTVGAHPGMRGPFTYLEFPDAALDDVLYMENALGESVFHENEDIVRRYLELYWELEKIACDPSGVDEYLERAKERLP